MQDCKREDRYFVLKLSDINKYLTHGEKESLMCISEEIDLCRRDNGKETLKVVVVEHDWPEYEPTWAAIEARMKNAN